MKLEKLKKYTGGFTVYCRENRKTVRLMVLFVLLLLCLQIFSAYLGRTVYITDDNGNLVGIQRNTEKETESVPLNIEAKKGNLKVKEEVILSIKGGPTSKGKVKEKTAENPAEELKKSISQMIRTVEQNTEETVLLPTLLEDGTKVIWKKQKNLKPLMTLLLLPLLLLFLYRSEKEKLDKVVMEKQESVKRSLPAFNSQILLLLHSGLIFSDAFSQIAESYAIREKSGYFGEIIEELYIKSRESEKSIVTLLNEYAKSLGIREFSRFVAIVSDNQYKGVNLTEKLEEESALLWNQRKKLAEEKGRTTETKLSFPLAMLLLVLILITAAPAVLQI